jgi:hypothetical protein
MNDKDQKIIHRWDYGFGKPTWTTQSSKNISKVLDHLKLGLDNETALNRRFSWCLRQWACLSPHKSMNREYLRQFHYLTPTLDDLKLY